MTDFLYMGGYWLYVWGSYLLVFVVLAINIVQPIMRQKAMKRSLLRRARLEKRQL